MLLDFPASKTVSQSKSLFFINYSACDILLQEQKMHQEKFAAKVSCSCYFFQSVSSPLSDQEFSKFASNLQPK
jgi:hypothetical protein